MKYKSFKLPDSFLMGSATASLQIEGGDRNNSWYRWAEEGHIKDGSHCIEASDHWNRVDEDIALMKKMNHQTYRMSLEWSRIEPKKGQFNAEAIARYRDEIIKLKAAGIEPLVTLHHFSNPLWLEDAGSWINPDVVIRFEKYSEYVVHALGDLVSDWVTINEPNVYLLVSYLYGEWPPGHNSTLEYLKGAKHMIQAHLLAYQRIHTTRKLMGYSNTRVGTAIHLRLFDPLNGLAREKFSANLIKHLFQDIFIAGMMEGRFLFPVGLGGHAFDKGIYSDYIGINYYTRDMIGFNMNPAKVFGERLVREGAATNDLGWEIYPEGIYRICHEIFDRYKLPIYITENGTADAKDAFRADFIYQHLFQIKRLIDEGLPIERYYHWTTMDNFEWIEGLSSRFGLIKINYKNQKRSIRKSGRFYAEISKKKEVNEKMIEKYLS